MASEQAKLALVQGDSDLPRWRYDPVAFAKEALGIEPWETQALIMAAVVAHHNVAVRSGHKVGKTLLLAILAIWWAVCWPDGKVLITAPTFDQLRDTVWPEVRKRWQRAREIGLISIPEPAKDPSTGIRWPDGRHIIARSTDKPERIQGYSGPACLYLIDEASGVPQEIYEALVGNTGGGSGDDDSAVAKFVIAGNPTQTSGILFDAFNQHRGRWKCFAISSEDTPNAQQDRIVIRGLATRYYCDVIESKYGRDSDIHRVRVTGDFPRKGGSSIIPLELAEAAKNRSLDGKGRLEIGVDVARFGDDDSASTCRRGKRAFDQRVVNGFDEHNVAGMVLNQAREHHVKGEPIPLVKVDACGVGAGVVSVLRQARDEHGAPLVEVLPVDAGEKSDVEDDYPNKRSQLWFGCADWLVDADMPNDDDLVSDLTAPKYGFDARGRRVAEKKESFKKRLGRSPDRGDALCLAVYSPHTGIGVALPSELHAFNGGYRWNIGRGFG